jgi:hypothetical protein
MTTQYFIRGGDGIHNLVELKGVDRSTEVPTTIDYPHHEIHGGSSFFLVYSVPDLGAMTSPDDAITLTFKTGDTLKWPHFIFQVIGSAGWLVKFVEAPSGGGATPTGSKSIYNHNRNKVSTKSGIHDVAGTPVVDKISYDATLVTGGLTLIEEYIPGDKKVGHGVAGSRDEIILKQATIYQLSCYGVGADPATLKLSWYEHTNK